MPMHGQFRKCTICVSTVHIWYILSPDIHAYADIKHPGFISNIGNKVNNLMLLESS